VTGAYTLEMLSKKYGVGKASISKRAKREGWKKLDMETTAELVELERANKRKKTILKETKKETGVEPSDLERAIGEIADIKTYIMNLQLIAAQKIKETLVDGSVEEIVVVPGDIGHVEVADRKLNPRELKSLVDAIDKAGQTLGVVPRFGQQVNIQNNQTIEQKTLEVRIVGVEGECGTEGS